MLLDKTGTVTSPQMEVREVVPLDVEAYPETEISDILGAFYRCLEPDNDTAKAIAERYSYGPAWPHRETVPFSSATKWSAVNFPGRGAYVLGAPEYVLGSEFAPLEKRTAYYAEKGCRVLLCLNKCDLDPAEELYGIYSGSAIRVLRVSAVTGQGIDELRRELAGKLSAFTGNSGVGKSSLLNRLCPQAASVTGSVSEKIGRGRHTTRHSEIYSLGNQTFLFDTPGFSSLKPPEVEKEELRRYFTEFLPYEGQCKYWGCTHIHEPGCMVKEARERGEIGETRYENYVQIFNELAECERRGNWRNKK